MTTTFDATKFKSTTLTQWQDAAEAWHRWGPTLKTWLGPATERMMDLGSIGKGDRVLDVAAGAGEQTLAVARRVGSDGHVLATDLSPRILEYAECSARDAGHFHVSTLAVDGEELDVEPGSFDAAISRVGMIYFPDQQRALKRILAALKPGGKFATIVYATAANNGFFSIPVSIIRERAELPPPMPGQPGPFSLGSPGVLADTLREAGFKDVVSETVSAPLHMAKATDCLDFERESFGALHQMLSGLDDQAKEATWKEIEEALCKFEGPKGFEGPCELVIAAGTK